MGARVMVVVLLAAVTAVAACSKNEPREPAHQPVTAAAQRHDAGAGKVVAHAKATLPAIDRRCTTDADCVAIRRLYVSAKSCCHSCNTDAVAKSWVAPAQRACAAMGSAGCPIKKCVALKPVRCHRGQCELKIR